MGYFERHSKIALQFSGGRDSLVLLELFRPRWDQLTVVWGNTGDAAQETLAQMDEVKKTVPHFLEVTSDQPAQIKQEGYPADVMSVWDSPMGRVYDDSREFRVQPAMNCCWHNLWVPLNKAMHDEGFTLVIRGQRNSERLKAPVKSGHIEDGIEYWFPIEGWNDEAIVTFLDAKKIKMPRNYGTFKSSMDCLHCTAYMAENEKKLEYLVRFYPTAAAEVATRLRYIRAAARNELKHIDNALEVYA